MNIKYYYLDQSSITHGSFSKIELQKLYQSDQIQTHTLVAEEGGEWSTLESLNLFSLKKKTPFKQVLRKNYKSLVALCFILMAVAGTLYATGIINKSTFQSKQSKYESLIEEMRKCRTTVDHAVGQINGGKISDQEFSELMEKQLEPLKKIDKQFKKLGIPERYLQIKLLKTLGELQQPNNIRIALRDGKIEQDTLHTYLAKHVRPLNRIKEDYLLNDEDLKGQNGIINR